MNEPPELSICIVNWNGCALLRNLLLSLDNAAEALKREIIVVDNGSTDGSVAMLAAEFPDVVLLQNEHNLGFSRANNQAAAHARGRLLLFLNTDTIVRPLAVTHMVSFLDQHPEVAAAGPRLINADGSPRSRYATLPTFRALLYRIWLLRWTGAFRSAYRQFRRGHFDSSLSQPVAQISGAALLVRRDEFLRCGGWDEGFEFGYEDFDLSARLSQLGALYYLAQAEVVHLGGASSRSNLAFVYRGRECGRVRYLSKHAQNRLSPWIYKLLVTMDMPFRILALGLECGIKRLRGERERAERARFRLEAASEFLFFGLPRFWRS